VVQAMGTGGMDDEVRYPVKNKELFVSIKALISDHRLVGRFEWARGHSGDTYNERADEMASSYAGSLVGRGGLLKK